MRAKTNGIPVGFKLSAQHIEKDIDASVPTIPALARARRHLDSCDAAGHRHLRDFCSDDLTTFKTDMAYLTGVAYGGVAGPLPRR